MLYDRSLTQVNIFMSTVLKGLEKLSDFLEYLAGNERGLLEVCGDFVVFCW